MTSKEDIAEQIRRHGCRQQTSKEDFRDEYAEGPDSSQSVTRTLRTRQDQGTPSNKYLNNPNGQRWD